MHYDSKNKTKPLRKKRHRQLKGLTILLSSCLIALGLTSCFKNNNTPVLPQPELTGNTTDQSSNNLGTTNSTEVNEWLIPLISEYLIDDVPAIASCGDNTITVTGNQTITTQADVNALATADKIEGDLILNSSSNLDFSPLNLLQEVTGDLVLLSTANQISLTGFECLSIVGKDFGNKFAIGASPNTTLSSISGFSALSSVGGRFRIGSNTSLTSIPAFPALSSVGGVFGIVGNSVLTSFSGFPALNSVAGFNISVNDALTSFSGFATFTSTATYSYFTISRNSALTSIPNFPALSTVGNFSIFNNNALTSIPDFDSLTLVNGSFNLSENDVLTDIAGFSDLLSIGGYFRIRDHDALETLSGFTALEIVGGEFYISSNDVLNTIGNTTFISLEEINGDGMFIEENPNLAKLPTFFNLRIIANTFKIDNNNSLNVLEGFPILKFVGADLEITNNGEITSIIGFNELIASQIVGESRVDDNVKLNCPNPPPNFSPVDFSTGNFKDCP